MSEKKTNTKVKKYVNTNVLPTAIALIVVGLLFCIFRSGMLSILFTVVGAVLIILGIIKLINRIYAVGAVDLALGIVVIVCGWTILDITLLVIGIVAIVYGVYMLATAISKFKSMKGIDKVVSLIAPIFVIVIGVLLVVAKWQLSDAIFIVLGVLAMVDGIMLLAKK